MKNSILKISYLSLFLGLSVIIGILENFVPLPIPYAKLGFSNIVLMLVLYLFSKKYYLLVGALKVLLCALIFGGFGVSFYLSAGGFILSASVVCLLLIKEISLITVSCFGAVFHIIGQITVASVIYGNFGFFYYMPILLLASFICGIAVGILCIKIIPIIKKVSR